MSISKQTNRHLTKAVEAIKALGSDTSVPKAETLAALQAVDYVLETPKSALQDELSPEEYASVAALEDELIELCEEIEA